jgi:ketosteroid isomerase-like protein
MKPMSKPDFEEIIEMTHDALKEFYKGNPEPYRKLYSTKEDISLLGAQGGASIGKEVMEHLTTRASWFRSGENVHWESLVKFSTEDLGYAVEIEHFDAKVGGSDIVSVALRATTIFRKENDEWKIVHRQGDPLVSRIDPATYISLAKHNRVIAQ